MDPPPLLVADSQNPSQFSQNPFPEMDQNERQMCSSRNKRGNNGRRKRQQRFGFETRSEEDILDDGENMAKNLSTILPSSLGEFVHELLSMTSREAKQRQQYCYDNLRGNSQPSI
ncbi:hypothetical protein SASPL_108254 [Salvia splendens]|uniref:Uncharacterized protein n=1 Tax=Salvia splendens TaxID=180675 RepID=A0A8X8YGD1_SALSN|nr:hypothetical protein SASPL_108254 [Salvia splendens]